MIFLFKKHKSFSSRGITVSLNNLLGNFVILILFLISLLYIHLNSNMPVCRFHYYCLYLHTFPLPLKTHLFSFSLQFGVLPTGLPSGLRDCFRIVHRFYVLFSFSLIFSLISCGKTRLFSSAHYCKYLCIIPYKMLP